MLVLALAILYRFAINTSLSKSIIVLLPTPKKVIIMINQTQNTTPSWVSLSQILPSNQVMLTEHEAAELLRRKVTTLRTDRVRGGGIAYVKVGRNVRYRLSDVQALLNGLPPLASTSQIVEA
jgi:hypothetical protein